MKQHSADSDFSIAFSRIIPLTQMILSIPIISTFFINTSICNRLLTNDPIFFVQDEIHERDRFSDFMLAIIRY